MKKLMILGVAALVMSACGNKAAKGGDNDSTAIANDVVATPIESALTKDLTKEEMDKLNNMCEDALDGCDIGTLDKWALIDIDGDGYEELWLTCSEKDSDGNAFFTQRKSESRAADGYAEWWTLLAAVPTGYHIELFRDRISAWIFAGGPSVSYLYYMIKNSLLTHEWGALEIYGKVDEADYDNKPIGQAEVDSLRSQFSEEEVQMDVHWKTVK